MKELRTRWINRMAAGSAHSPTFIFPRMAVMASVAHSISINQVSECQRLPHMPLPRYREKQVVSNRPIFVSG
jgi:hypothetical protein